MEEQTYDVHPDAVLIIRARKSVTLHGEDVAHVHIDGKGAADATWEESPDGQYRLAVHKDIQIKVPRTITIRVEEIRGHLHGEDLPQGLHARQIGGHMHLQRTGPVLIENVGGHIHLHHIHGLAHIDHVGGHGHIAHCTGDVRIAHIGGHVKVQDVVGECHLPAVGGHAQMDMVQGPQTIDAGGALRTHIHPQPGQTYELRAGGQLTCRIPRDADATIELHSPTLGRPHSSGSQTRVMGSGAARVRLTAGGHITFIEEPPAGTEPDPDTLDDIQDTQWATEGVAQQIRTGVNSALTNVRTRINQALDEKGLTAEQRAELQEQFADIAGEAAESVRETVEMLNDRARQIWEREMKSRVQAPTDMAGNAPRDAGREGDSEALAQAKAEERKMVLRMLAEGKITVEEANDLIQTLIS